LALHKSSDRLDGVAILELNSEGMFGQCDARLCLIRLQGRLEKGLKMRRS